ncbi:MAG: hypothetical protein Q7S45_02070 [Candidatus Curtissbacteria bacterium]|nr:hypothetical protein [Candidatus Curtissbacteria bacterium]
MKDQEPKKGHEYNIGLVAAGGALIYIGIASIEGQPVIGILLFGIGAYVMTKASR